MADFILRDAAPGDEALVLRFIRELAEYEHLLHEVRATEAGLRHLLFGPRPYAEALIAEAGGQPVGFALWFYTVSTFNGAPSLYVEDVYVQQARRGGGIGRAMFSDLAQRALARGCTRMDWSVLDWNEPSIRFYRAIGAQPVKGWTLQRLTGGALAKLAGGAG
jgi:GNAT superfamily N-acetyltransferase